MASIYWNSFAEFIAMGQHGVYVWGAVGVMALAMIVEPLLLVRGQRALVIRLRRQYRAENHDLAAALSSRSEGQH